MSSPDPTPAPAPAPKARREARRTYGAIAREDVEAGHPVEEEPIPAAVFRKTMRLVRLQNNIPISVLVSLGTGLICALIIHPGMGEISLLHPTLLTPNNTLVGIYWVVVYALQVGFCLLLWLAYRDETKDLLINGVGMRFAVANWLMAMWCVCWTLQLFKTAEVVCIVNTLIVLSIHFTLLEYPPSWKHPLDALLVHAMTSFFLAALLDLHFLHGGSVALEWFIEHRKERTKYTWPAVGAVIAVNSIQVIWQIYAHAYALAVGGFYILLALLLSTPRTNPSLPESAMPKPTPLIVTFIIFLVLHPLSIVATFMLGRAKEREGRVRLADEIMQAENRAREAERRAAQAEAHDRTHVHTEADARAQQASPAEVPTGDLIGDE